jgi:hypothetical protein
MYQLSPQESLRIRANELVKNRGHDRWDRARGRDYERVNLTSFSPRRLQAGMVWIAGLLLTGIRLVGEGHS